MKGKMSTEMGDIIIDKDVLAKYAGAATTECIGKCKRRSDKTFKKRECRKRSKHKYC